MLFHGRSAPQLFIHFPAGRHLTCFQFGGNRYFHQLPLTASQAHSHFISQKRRDPVFKLVSPKIGWRGCGRQLSHCQLWGAELGLACLIDRLPTWGLGGERPLKLGPCDSGPCWKSGVPWPCSGQHLCGPWGDEERGLQEGRPALLPPQLGCTLGWHMALHLLFLVSPRLGRGLRAPVWTVARVG